MKRKEQAVHFPSFAAEDQNDMALSALVKERYDAALKSGDLLFFPGDINRKNAKGMEVIRNNFAARSSIHIDCLLNPTKQFEITYAPALAEKPRLEMPQSEDGKKVKVNPFLPPNPALHVKDLDEHRVLLNKFCVTPHHILVVTKGQEQWVIRISLITVLKEIVL